MLEITEASVRYGSGRKAVTVVDSVSLRVPKGGTLGLVGESGSGKSSIAKAVMGLAPLVSGRVTIDGADFTSRRRRNSSEFRRMVQMIFQDPYSSLNPRMTVADALIEAQLTLRRSRSERAKEARRLLDRVGLPESALERYPFEFSGGQRQRIAIARAIAVHPRMLICDEVTSALDVSVQATILNLLRDLQAELGFSCLFISHDLAAVRCMSDDVAVIYSGEIVEVASAEALFRATEHPYSQSLLSSIAEVGVKRRPILLRGEIPDPRDRPRGCTFSTRCPIGPVHRGDRQICLDVDPQTLAEGNPHRAACHFPGSAENLAVAGGSAEA